MEKKIFFNIMPESLIHDAFQTSDESFSDFILTAVFNCAGFEIGGDLSPVLNFSWVYCLRV